MMNRTYGGAIPAEDVFTIRSNNVTISGFYIAEALQEWIWTESRDFLKACKTA